MKICHFYLSFDPAFGGPATSVPYMCIGLHQEGVNVSAASYWSEKSNKTWMEKHDIPVFQIKNEKKGVLSALFKPELRKFLKTLTNNDSFHIHGILTPFAYFIAKEAKRRGIPYLINPRGDLEITRVNNVGKLKAIKKHIAISLYARWMGNNAACMVCTSIQEAKGLRYFGVKSPIAIIPNGLDISAFPESVQKIKHEKKTVLYLGRFSRIKGLDLLVEAWSKLPKQLMEEWELHIIGNSTPPDYIEKIKIRINENNLNDNVKIFGPMTGEKKIEKYLSSDLFILPTRNENFGNVVAEAMLCELPVITTKNAPWDLIDKYDAGKWIDLSIDNIVESLVEIMEKTSEERDEMGKRGRQCIMDNFTLPHVAKMNKVLYEWVLGNGPEPEFMFKE